MSADTVFLAADPDITDDVIVPEMGPVCAVCSTPLSWSGKGFRPKYCADHKRGGKGREKTAGPTAAPSTSAKSRNATQVNRAIETLELAYRLGGAALHKTVAPTIGAAIANKSDKLAESYRLLLETNKAVRDWLTKVEGQAAWIPILVVHADLVLEIATAGAAQRAPEPTSEPDAPVYPPGWFDGYDDAPPRPDGA